MTYINPVKNNNGYMPHPRFTATNPATRKFLHIGGKTETKDRDYAWTGTRDQYDNLRQSLDADYVLDHVGRDKPKMGANFQ